MSSVVGILRLLSLSFLFAGAASIVFAAVVLVSAAKAQGVPVAEAAAANAPIFIYYSKIALGAAIILLVAEIIDFSRTRQRSKLVMARFAASILAVITAGVFALVIVPPMDNLLLSIKTDEAARQEFHHLHEVSRTVFGGTILFACVSLILTALLNKNDMAKLANTD